jgi:hypothetical protein
MVAITFFILVVRCELLGLRNGVISVSLLSLTKRGERAKTTRKTRNYYDEKTTS